MPSFRKKSLFRPLSNGKSEVIVKIKIGLLAFLGLLAWSFPQAGRTESGNAAVSPPERLRCEYLSNPLGLDVLQPRFSWIWGAAERRGVSQSAYHILVSSSRENLGRGVGDLWDSGKVMSDQMTGIDYAGHVLSSGKECWWKVKVWDERGNASAWSDEAHWTMGLLNTADWKALWITASLPEPPTADNFGYRSRSGKTKNDVKWVQIDLGAPEEIDSVRLWPAWPAQFKSPPGDGFPVRFKIEVSGKADFSDARMVVDRTAADVKNPGKEPLNLTFTPVNARYLRLTVTRLDGEWLATWDSTNNVWYPKSLARTDWTFALAEMEILSGNRNAALGRSVTDSDAVKDGGGWAKAYLTDGRRESDVGSAYHPRPAPLLRREFSCGKPVKRATLHATSLGCYEMFLNGSRIGDQQLAPGWTIYDKRVLYQTYDVTSLVQTGANAWGAMLGDGWFRMPKEMFDQFDSMKRFAGYGSYPGSESPWFLGQLELEYADGSRETLGTDAQWSCFTDGPLRRSSMYTGVFYDARKEVAGWARTGAVTGQWQAVTARPLTPGQILSPQKMEPIRVLEEIQPVARTEIKPGVFIYDFGRQLAGVCRIKVEGPAGSEIVLRHAEALKPDGSLYVGNLAGNAGNRDTFVLAGKGEYAAPFTYHGFRYVEVTGEKSATVQDIRALSFGNDVAQAGFFDSSDSRLNKVCEMVNRTYRSNMMSLMVDVAGRDERRPWLGDSFTDEIQSLCYLYDFAAFGANEELVILDAMGPDGSCPGQLRNANKSGSSSAAGWADACVTTPFFLAMNYADRKTLEEGYAGSKKFIDMIFRNNTNYVPGRVYGGTFGDWLSSPKTLAPGASSWSDVGKQTAPADFFAAAWWTHSARLTALMSEVLGREKDAGLYAEMAEKVRAELLKKYRKPDGSLSNGSQSVYALALDFDLLDTKDRKAALTNLFRAIEQHKNHLATGSFTTSSLLKALADNGAQELAYRLVMQPDFPSYGYMVDQGATAMWERLDAWHPTLGFNPNKMNGLNHLGQNSVYEWIAGSVGGLRPDFKNPGYRHFFIAPKLCGLAWMKFDYNSVSGRIETRYKIADGRIEMTVTVPPNTTATLAIPTAKAVAEGGKPAEQSQGVTFLQREAGATLYKLESGSYRFIADL